MRDRLNDVAWETLKHACGSASDVPAQLRALANRNRKRRDEALYALYGNIFHQGTRYSASGHAIPYLIELCRDDSVRDKFEIVDLIRHLVAGYFNVTEPGMWNDGEQLNDWGRMVPVASLNVEGQGATDALDALRRTYAEALRGIEVYFELLRSGDERTRASVAVLLACFSRHRETIAPALRDAFAREAAPPVRACLAFALGRVGESELLRRACCDVSPLVRLYAAMALVRTVRDPDVVQRIASGFGMRIDVRDLACSGGNLDGDLSAALADVPPELAEPALSLMMRALAEARGFGTLPIVRAILRAAFPEPADDQPPLSPDTVTPGQREVLTAMVRTQDMWSIGNVTALLSQHGLPCDRKQAAELAGAHFTHDDSRDQVSNACLLAQMGFAADALERFDAARAARPDALDAAPEPDRAWMSYGWALSCTAGRGRDAADAFCEAARLGFDRAVAMVESARILGEIGARQEQLSAAEEALCADERCVPALIEKSRALFELGRAVDAQRVAARAAELDPDDPLAHWQLSCAAAASGDLDAAIAAARSLLSLEPGQREALRREPSLACLRERLDFLSLLNH